VTGVQTCALPISADNFRLCNQLQQAIDVSGLAVQSASLVQGQDKNECIDRSALSLAKSLRQAGRFHEAFVVLNSRCDEYLPADLGRMTASSCILYGGRLARQLGQAGDADRMFRLFEQSGAFLAAPLEKQLGFQTEHLQATDRLGAEDRELLLGEQLQYLLRVDIEPSDSWLIFASELAIELDRFDGESSQLLRIFLCDRASGRFLNDARAWSLVPDTVSEIVRDNMIDVIGDALLHEQFPPDLADDAVRQIDAFNTLFANDQGARDLAEQRGLVFPIER